MQDNQDDLEETREIRTRQQTAKGKEFHIQLFKDQTTSAQRAWRKQLNKIENVLVVFENASVLQSERILLETKMKILVEVHERFDEALEDNFDAKHVPTQKFETWEREHTYALRRLKQRISESLLEPPVEEPRETKGKPDTELTDSAHAKEGQRSTNHKGPTVSFRRIR